MVYISDSLVLAVVQITFISVILIFVFSWCVRKVFPGTSQWKRVVKDESAAYEGQRTAQYRAEHNAWKQNIQKSYEEKATRYKNEIQIPRDREKRQRKEREFCKHFGPLWTGAGHNMRDNEDEEEADRDSAQSERRVRRRKVPEFDVTACNRRSDQGKAKPKRVIQLPPEPEEHDLAAILVTLRTPISTVVKRRFLQEHTLQAVLDFMTTVGFNQSRHHLYTSYPRQALSDPQVTLSQLGFEKRITLNIEGKD